MENWLVLGVIAALAAFWVDSLRARERAMAAGRAACGQLQVQWLDQTVSLAGLGLGRNSRGRVRIRRRYVFEFSINGADRWQGRVSLLGGTLEKVLMEHPEGALILP